VLGCIERPVDRGGHSLYASLVYIDSDGVIQSVHRKLMPTYEERLTWSPGDGHRLRVHKLGAFTVGGLNCWENWMPLVQASLYGQGEDLHIAIWPGGVHNTHNITRFIAFESVRM
jgi:nitrilase